VVRRFRVFCTAYLDATWRLRNLIAGARRGMALAAPWRWPRAPAQGRLDVQVSRTVAYQSLSLVAIGAYFAVLALATSAIATIGGDNARVLQTAFVLGSTAAILTLVSSPWLRAWAKVKLAKHFFRHRYDYRAEWMRFTETLGAPEGAAPLDERIVKAVADLTDSPAGLLLVPDGAGLGRRRLELGPQHLPVVAIPRSHHLATTPAASSNSTSVRPTPRAIDAPAVPQWMLDGADAWVLVPLPHLGGLAGAILLARPPVDRALDWEDFDLLKVAGRQVASYLAEARAQEALADAQRFDEFNRRFAFILHDIKNLVSQLTLTARNAERHADKPEFRADMIATLQDSAERMNACSPACRSTSRPARSAAARSRCALVERIAAPARPASGRRFRRPRRGGARRPGGARAIARPSRPERDRGEPGQRAGDARGIGADGIARHHRRDRQGLRHVPAFVRDKLFKPFVSSKPGGFGIGAFEARQLAQAMERAHRSHSARGRRHALPRDPQGRARRRSCRGSARMSGPHEGPSC
jgi:putative PEP-CTERM system histidine kinase